MKTSCAGETRLDRISLPALLIIAPEERDVYSSHNLYLNGSVRSRIYIALLRSAFVRLSNAINISLLWSGSRLNQDAASEHPREAQSTCDNALRTCQPRRPQHALRIQTCAANS